VQCNRQGKPLLIEKFFRFLPEKNRQFLKATKLTSQQKTLSLKFHMSGELKGKYQGFCHAAM
jgi:hypothetical protein